MCMCPIQWEVTSTVLVIDTCFGPHILELFDMTSFHPVSSPGAVTKAGSIHVAAQLHSTLQMMSNLNLLVLSKAQTSCLHHLRGAHGETAHLNL